MSSAAPGDEAQPPPEVSAAVAPPTLDDGGGGSAEVDDEALVARVEEQLAAAQCCRDMEEAARQADLVAAELRQRLADLDQELDEQRWEAEEALTRAVDDSAQMRRHVAELEQHLDEEEEKTSRAVAGFSQVLQACQATTADASELRHMLFELQGAQPQEGQLQEESTAMLQATRHRSCEVLDLRHVEVAALAADSAAAATAASAASVQELRQRVHELLCEHSGGPQLAEEALAELTARASGRTTGALRCSSMASGLAVRAPLVLAGLVGVNGQFGGGGGYNPPAPICPAFQCEAGEVAVGKPENHLWSYGCKDSGMNVLNAGSFDPNNPLGGMSQGPSVDKCCIERDICRQTCGMPSKTCHDNFQKCSTKICKGNQNCQLQAMVSEMMSEPVDDEPASDPKKYDPDTAKCKGYNRGQKEACMCVPKADAKGAIEGKLTSFYSAYNPEKVDSSGGIKDLDDVWKKWKGKEADMFLALGNKYKKQAVQMRQKPKRDNPYAKDSFAKDKKSDASASEAAPDKSRDAADAEQDVAEDDDAAAFTRKRAALERQKQDAKKNEDYDAAGEAKEEIAELTRQEVERLAALKDAAVAEERYMDAKRLKQQLKKLEEL